MESRLGRRLTNLFHPENVGMEYVISALAAFTQISNLETFLWCPSALDYPPFFAYFEFVMSIPARLIDAKIVDVYNLNYGAWSVVAYQRTTVILTELVLANGLLELLTVLLGCRSKGVALGKCLREL